MHNDFDLQISNIYDDGDFLWFTAYSFGALYRMSKKDMKAEFVVSFEQENMSEIRLYSDIVAWNEFLILTPLRAKNIAIYNKITKKVKYIEIDIEGNEYIEGYTGWNYYSAQLYEDNVYFFPHQRTVVLKLNLCKQTVEIVKEWTEDLVSSDVLHYPRIYSKTRLVGNIVYAPISGANKLQIINLQESSSEIIDIDEKEAAYSDAYVVGGNIYLSPLEGKNIACINIQENKQEFISVHDSKQPYMHYLGILEYDQKLLFIPEYHGNITVLDLDSGAVTDCEDNEIEMVLKDLCTVFKNESKYMDFSEGINESYLYCNRNGVLIRLQANEIKVYKITAKVPEKIRRGISDALIEHGEIVNESNLVSISDFIESLKVSKLRKDGYA